MKEFLVLEHNYFSQVLEHTYLAFDTLLSKAQVRTQYTQTPGYELSDWSDTEDCQASYCILEDDQEVRQKPTRSPTVKHRPSPVKEKSLNGFVLSNTMIDQIVSQN